MYTDVHDQIKETALQMFKANDKHFRTDCGSYLFSPRHSDGKMKFSDKMDEKQAVLYNAARKASAVLETGTYMGHSLAIMLHANPNLRVTTIDLTENYCRGSLDVLRKKFPNAQIEFIQGNSLDVIPTLKSTYDMFHFDGSHKPDVVRQEFISSLNLFDKTKSEIRFVIDDLFYTELARDIS